MTLVNADKGEEMGDDSEGTGRRTTYGYRVEARCDEDDWGIDGPPEIGRVHLATSWRTLLFDKARVGVPNSLLDPEAENQGLLSYPAAKALMAWAAAHHTHRRGIEFRLVKVKVETEWTRTVEGYSEPERFDYRAVREAEWTSPESENSES